MEALLLMGKALILTILIEGFTMMLVYPFFQGESRFMMLFFSLLCNLLTNPMLNLLIILIGWNQLLILFLELCVVFVEAYVYRITTYLNTKKSLLLAAILNVVSYGIGCML